MRTTLDVEPDVLTAARAIARTEKVSLGQAVSALARRGMENRLASRIEDGFPVFDVPADAPPITDEMVASILEER